MWGWLVQAASDRGSSPAGQGAGRGRRVKGAPGAGEGAARGCSGKRPGDAGHSPDSRWRRVRQTQVRVSVGDVPEMGCGLAMWRPGGVL